MTFWHVMEATNFAYYSPKQRLVMPKKSPDARIQRSSPFLLPSMVKKLKLRRRLAWRRRVRAMTFLPCYIVLVTHVERGKSQHFWLMAPGAEKISYRGRVNSLVRALFLSTYWYRFLSRSIKTSRQVFGNRL